MRGIRFKPDMIQWIIEGKKSTTFRKTRRKGLYEIVKGSWYKPVGLGIIVRCYPCGILSKELLVNSLYNYEGPFETPGEFKEWLIKNKFYNKLPNNGWINLVKYVRMKKIVRGLENEKQNV